MNEVVIGYSRLVYRSLKIGLGWIKVREDESQREKGKQDKKTGTRAIRFDGLLARASIGFRFVGSHLSKSDRI